MAAVVEFVAATEVVVVGVVSVVADGDINVKGNFIRDDLGGRDGDDSSLE